MQEINQEIQPKELNQKRAAGYVLADIRPEESFAYGHIPGAVSLPYVNLLDFCKRIGAGGASGKRKYILYCKNGELSASVCRAIQAAQSGKESEKAKESEKSAQRSKAAEYGSVTQAQSDDRGNAQNNGKNDSENDGKSEEGGYELCCLAGGYAAWLKSRLDLLDEGAGETARNIEKSIQKKFHKELFTKFARAINEYDMLQPGDRVAVCISGGKDSMLLAKLFQELKRHNKFSFELVFLCMDPGYSAENREVIERNAKLMDIPLTIFTTDIFENVLHIPKSPCYICARMRRGHLYAKAKELGCNKIALGHHFDDVIETTLMGMLYGGQMQTMMPKLHSTNFPGMELIRPLYLVREKDIVAWRNYNGLSFLQCACKFTEQCSLETNVRESVSKRKKVKSIIADLAKEDPEIEMNIFRSSENVALSTVIAYKDKSGVRHSFLDDYGSGKDSANGSDGNGGEDSE